MFTAVFVGPPYEIEVTDNPDEPGLIGTVAIARDEATQRSVFVETLLSPAEVDGFAHSEISFQIAVLSDDESEPQFRTQMRDMARPYLPPESVSHVIEMVCASCRIMIEKTKPELLYFVAKEVVRSPKALVKYERLNQVLKELGYVIYELDDDPLGRPFWKLALPRNVKGGEITAGI
ncbi:MAG: hypothetical protein K2Y27_16135 [Xanthobacteraceae bacterium]|nr:hypothetical protein [Xanthobacteraceae bacterium]